MQFFQAINWLPLKHLGKAYLVDIKRCTPRFIYAQGIRVAVFEGLNIYVNTKGAAPKFATNTCSLSTYCPEIAPNVFSFGGAFLTDEDFQQAIARLTTLDNWIKEQLIILSDIDKHNAQAEKNRIEAREEREKQEKIKEEENEKRKLQKEAEYQLMLNKAEEDFIRGEQIHWEYFEALCLKHAKDFMRVCGYFEEDKGVENNGK